MHIAFQYLIRSSDFRIINEGLPVSEAYQCSQKEKKTVLPLHSLESVTEWQRKAEYYIEKPQLELLGEKVRYFNFIFFTFFLFSDSNILKNNMLLFWII